MNNDYKALLVNEDGTPVLVGSLREAKELAKGKALIYSLSLIASVGYNKAEQTIQEVPQDFLKKNEEAPKKKGRGKSKK